MVFVLQNASTVSFSHHRSDVTYIGSAYLCVSILKPILGTFLSTSASVRPLGEQEFPKGSFQYQCDFFALRYIWNFSPPKIFAASRRFFSFINTFNNENTYRKAPQANFFGYHASSIAISFIKLDENTGFLPKIPYNPQNICGIFGANLKISPI